MNTIELYFLITNQKVRDDFEVYEKNDKAMREAFRVLADDFGIKAKQYYTYTDRLAVVLLPEEVKRFRPSLMQGSDTHFKKKSLESMRWRELLKEKGVIGKRRPAMWDYLPWGIGKTTSNILKLDDQIYGYYEFQAESADVMRALIPQGFTEIKAWQYHKAIDDYNDRIEAKKGGGADHAEHDI